MSLDIESGHHVRASSEKGDTSAERHDLTSTMMNDGTVHLPAAFSDTAGLVVPSLGRPLLSTAMVMDPNRNSVPRLTGRLVGVTDGRFFVEARRPEGDLLGRQSQSPWHDHCDYNRACSSTVMDDTSPTPRVTAPEHFATTIDASWEEKATSLSLLHRARPPLHLSNLYQLTEQQATYQQQQHSSPSPEQNTVITSQPTLHPSSSTSPVSSREKKPDSLAYSSQDCQVEFGGPRRALSTSGNCAAWPTIEENAWDAKEEEQPRTEAATRPEFTSVAVTRSPIDIRLETLTMGYSAAENNNMADSYHPPTTSQSSLPGSWGHHGNNTRNFNIDSGAKMDEGEAEIHSAASERTYPTTIEHKERDLEDDNTTIRSIESTDIVHSPALTSLQGPPHLAALTDSPHAIAEVNALESSMSQTPVPSVQQQHNVALVGTPSTVSTVPETDDGSLGSHLVDYQHQYRATMRMDSAGAIDFQHASARAPLAAHRRVPSWEGLSPMGGDHGSFNLSGQHHGLPLPFVAPNSGAWGQPSQQQQPHYSQARVASFRSDLPIQQHVSYASATLARSNDASALRWQQQQQTTMGPQHHSAFRAQDNRSFRPTASGFHPYPIQQQPSQQVQGPQLMQQQQHGIQQRKNPAASYSQPPLPPSATTTPPRGSASVLRSNARFAHTVATPHRPTSASVPSSSSGNVPTSHASPSGSNTGIGGARSSGEVLKTLLRKKACLYEADTSRAVALVTWLVGRELALEYGFFSRQQLQAGVHACVADKIEAGVITRTKVNRCMQIILNSCFHYIIPRPDGTEENGDLFKEQFAEEVMDESNLLRALPVPWHDMQVHRDVVLTASTISEVEVKASSHTASTGPSTKRPAASTPTVTPQSSPRLTSVAPTSPSKESTDGDSDTKRAVLLCFNENVRRAEDVFRCHNEFIRDTAHAANLQLSSQEWQHFFGLDTTGSLFTWGNVGVPATHCEGHRPDRIDALGVMTKDELGMFRSSWCSKRYDHDHDLCGFAHAEVNRGWLRRNPDTHGYKDELCPHVSSYTDNKRVGSVTYFMNECPQGVDCEYAHSLEEITYHPQRYKTKQCNSLNRPGGCPLGDVCPNFHPSGLYRFPKRTDGRSPRHHNNRTSHNNNNNNAINNPRGGPTTLPVGSPILYASPAPLSSFEHHLLLPGLQNLFRRHCSVVRAHLRQEPCLCGYSYFGDDSSLNVRPAATSPIAPGSGRAKLRPSLTVDAMSTAATART